VPEDRLRIVLSGLISAKGQKAFGVDVQGIELRAEDIDWSFGSGKPVTAPAQEPALILAGRTVPGISYGNEIL
jgi:hypothetical protein